MISTMRSRGLIAASETYQHLNDGCSAAAAQEQTIDDPVASEQGASR